jgi:predicted secreted acid phosphatase
LVPKARVELYCTDEWSIRRDNAIEARYEAFANVAKSDKPQGIALSPGFNPGYPWIGLKMLVYKVILMPNSGLMAVPMDDHPFDSRSPVVRELGVGAWAAPKIWKVLSLLGTALFASCVATERSSFISVNTQPANVGDAGIAARAYHDSGAYNRDLTTVANRAALWISGRAASVGQPALVLDIDETALSNWEIIVLDDFGRPIAGPCDPGSGAPCGWAAWDQLGRDPAIEPTLQVFRRARGAHVTVFFITGRPENQRAATERNLRQAGFAGYARLFMVPNGAHFASAADFKAPVRAEIERLGYTIIANMGDQPSDLLGGHAEKKFLLPNPFYRVR